MDDRQIEELRKWAVGLVADDRTEVKAAAKAILLLTDDLQAARSQLGENNLRSGVSEAALADVEAGPQTGRDRGDRLRARLGQPPSR
jgi:hypothetical protein